MEEIYVVKVRTEPDPARLYPSERRYSALTVGGLGAVHLLLGATSLLLGGLGLALQSDTCWTGRYGGGLWLGIAAAAAGAAGILAWRRWYVDNNIRWFFICSTVAATTSLLCLVITAAALAAIQEQRSNQDLYRSIYYDQGFVHPHNIQEQPVVTSSFDDIPSLSFQVAQENGSNTPESHGRVDEVTKMPSFHDSDKGIDHLPNSSTGVQNSAGALNFPNLQDVHIGVTTENISHGLDDLSLDDFEINISHASKDEHYSPEDIENKHSKISNQEESDTETKVVKGNKNGNNEEYTHIMRIANAKSNKTLNNTFDFLNIAKDLSKFHMMLEPTAGSEIEDEINRPKKSTEEYEDQSGGFQKGVLVEEDTTPKIYNNDESQDIMTIPSIKYEPQDVQNIPEIIHNDNVDINHTIPKFSSPNEKLEQPEYHKVPRGGREVRTVVAINILVASALELAWSLLSASIAWKGMKNCYPHENASSSCERTVEGLERTPPPPPLSSNGTYNSSKRHKTDGVFRKPDIISNHRHCHPNNSIHLNTVQSKNGINRLHMINTVSERIEPYLPMEESTMEYQERVHRFLASNNVANNNSDSASNIDS
ncbi:uncharacterized protein [Periplaneta americana]|uniref:uncharacterized protein n=1 Tax=Periplaneta americana TaxID=6978 RepID=UPI0037E81080